MSKKNQRPVSAERASDPHGAPAVESKAAPKEASDDGGEARDREIIRVFMEVAPLFAEVLERQVDLAIRREAKEPEFHFEIKEESTAWRQYKKQIQEVVGPLQALIKLVDKRLKGLLEAQRWFDSLGN